MFFSTYVVFTYVISTVNNKVNFKEMFVNLNTNLSVIETFGILYKFK